MKKLWFLIALVILLGAFSIDPAPAQAQNCELDWHPPPCGIPPPPKAISDKDKNAAKALQRYYMGSAAFLQSIAVGGALVAGPIGGAGPQVGAIVSGYKAWSWGQVVSDPWDENFQQPYDGGHWYSAEELGLWYTNYQSLNNLVWVAQAIIYYADFVYVSANRATSCQMAQINCFDWQKQRVDWGLSQMGNVLAISRDNFTWAAMEADWEGANSWIGIKFREIADNDNWGAGEFQ